MGLARKERLGGQEERIVRGWRKGCGGKKGKAVGEGGGEKKIVRVGEGKVVRWRGGERKTSFGKQKNDKSALHI